MPDKTTAIKFKKILQYAKRGVFHEYVTTRDEDKKAELQAIEAEIMGLLQIINAAIES